MVREDLIVSAVSFLQDPTVASAPLEKRIAFLQSKNLTQEEIDIALARASEAPNATNTATPAPSTPAGYSYKQPPPPPPGYGAHQGYWQQPPPPELPKRDWRDWFIMATVMGGVGYGLYFTAKRYILPLIKPPTPPQLEQDKLSIDESFNRAFALLDQLGTDTAALKTSEEARTQRLDTALSEMESVLSSLKESSRRRDDDSRRLEDDVRGLRELIPKALEAQKEATDTRLKDLGTELKSLKTLVANRMSGGVGLPGRPAVTSHASSMGLYGSQSTPAVNGTLSTPASSSSTTGAQAGTSTVAADGQASSSSSATDRAQSASPYGRFSGAQATIPSWQMAAAKKTQASEGTEKQDTSESGTVTEAGPGA